MEELSTGANRRNRGFLLFLLCSLCFLLFNPPPVFPAVAQEHRLSLAPAAMVNEAKWGNPGALLDEQNTIGDPPQTPAKTPWDTDWQHVKDFPISAYLDLGREQPLSALWVFDINSEGPLEIAIGEPGNWTKVASYGCQRYLEWAKIPLDASTRYLRLTRVDPGAQIAEIALYAYTPAAWEAVQARKKAEAAAAEQKRLALAQAREEAANRPRIDLGPPFGTATLVDEIDCAAPKPEHLFTEHPAGASAVKSLLGQTCRLLPSRPGEASYLSFRLGRYKLLKPGSAYLLTLEYPEDAPRSMLVLNGGCETARGFHTGTTTGDALRAKYVWSNPESLHIPLSGKIETWRQLFFLHDRFPERAFIRGPGPRTLTPDDGFPVTIAQFSAENDPPSQGIALRRIRLFEIADPASLRLNLQPLPDALPQRHIFWREEMADGVIESTDPAQRGIQTPLDWYRYKARLMRFLGIDTFAKDLLEFGACQHWDPTPGGGNDWVFFSEPHKDLWRQIVQLMGREGFSVLPYYEYAGSRGYKSLGHQRRAKPLTRDDAFTHISWIEQANADLTDPDTVVDFKKMLDLTIVRFKDQAHFLGAWLRPRMQLPIGFGDPTRARFAAEANSGRPVTRDELKNDKALLARYQNWWLGKRRAFLAAMRDHLRAAGVNPDPLILFTADPSEPGVSFPTWERWLVCDDVPAATAWLAPGNAGAEKPILAKSIPELSSKNLYLQALTTPPLDWGGWEVGHASPAADPTNYLDTPGLLLSHSLNNLLSVSTPSTLTSFRNPSGLALVRHYALNEDMLSDKSGAPLLGYVVADVELAGPYCMLSEAVAVANGDPTHLGYLVGSCFNRGFPEYVRDFNQAFLSLPALPSKRLEGVASDPAVVVRAIDTPRSGTWLAIVNTGLVQKASVKIKLPVSGTPTDAVTGERIDEQGRVVTLDLRPAQLRALRLRQ